MCDKVATTVEHVPPRCLFPEKKDLPNGYDLRKQLITVPACDEHNLKKTKDDEYFLYILVMSLSANEVAKSQFLTKVMRAIKRNPSLLNRFLDKHRPITLQNFENKEWSRTIAIEVDLDRFDRSVDMLARALHYHFYKEKWLEGIEIQPDFLLSFTPQTAQQTNNLIGSFSKTADVLFSKQSNYGENPNVFKYQVIDENDRLINSKDGIEKLMRFNFYNGCRIILIFRSLE